MSVRGTERRGQPAREQDQERDQALFGLMAVAEEQQAAVREALAGLATQQAALEQQQARLEQWTEAVQAEAAGLRRIAGEVGPGLARSTREAVETAVERGLAGAGATATAAVQRAAQPLLDGLAGVSAQAGAVEAALRRVVGWATWRLLGQGVLAVAGLAGLLWLAQVSGWWWGWRALEEVRAQKAMVEAEVTALAAQRDELLANRDALVREGMLARIVRCNPGNRPCVRINEAAGTFEAGGQADYRVLRGY